ncbi:ABC-F family ATP-binding cassette domain-containing protein [Lactobacillus sp. CC-MHH1034]|uniref:ABC-F family ATP-binding cassette domain-containing protein n=1 Tax=Agrilactobacillus fermenti TaxID=2586909 RepID=UPI0022A942A1|nr:ABC-F family ATP-binding cassette domain-containing protein [Agrilactobacillus fermenti]MCD2256748.1 ABC-F family ATP-binding cassette domain-containing protein [Agrilactobacillus fermenti]
MILLQAQKVAREFSGDYIFKNLSLEIQTGDRTALVGPNGAGKSTLLKILAGINAPDEGQVTTPKDMTMGYLAQDTGLDSDKTIYEEMLTVFAPLQKMEQQMHDLETQMANDAHNTELLKQYDNLQHRFTEQNGYGYQAEIRGVLHGFQFPESVQSKPINTLSGGEKSRLALAKLLLEKRDLLILDEPTNHLDIETLTWLENYLSGYPGALLVVSHDRYFLDHVVHDVYEIHSDRLDHYKGNYSKFLVEKQKHLELEWKAYEKQQAEIKKMQDFVDKNIVRASTTKQAQSRRKQLEKLDRIQKPTNDDQTIHFRFEAETKSGNDVLRVKNAAIGYEPDKIMAEPVNLSVDRRHIHAIIGTNGVGKSTLLRSIIGQIPLIKGEIQLGTGVSIGYYDQEQRNLHPSKTVLDEIWDEHPTMPEKDIRTILGSFLFTGDDVAKVVAQLSGGEKARLLLTKLALEHDNFLIMDEPTNHLDIDSKEVLQQALENFNGTVLFVSHDRYFINRLATEITEITPEGSTLYLGNYDYYLEKKAEIEAMKAEDNPTTPTDTSGNTQAQTAYKESKTEQRARRKLEREVATLETQIDDLTAQSQDIQTQMAAPEIATSYSKMQALQEQLDAIEQKLAPLEEAWTEKSMLLEDGGQD